MAAGWHHVPSHMGLLAQVTPRPRTGVTPTVGMIVIPTSRADPAGSNGVRTAVDLARSGGAQRMLILCSKEAATPAAVAALETMLASRLPPGVPAAVSVVSDGAGAVPAFEVDGLTVTSAYRRYAGNIAASWRYANDVGLKRNLSLLLAARLGLSSVLFLDDDVRPRSAPGAAPAEPARDTLHPTALADALGALRHDGLAAVGWTLRGYDDNSVVCRARGLTGHRQSQFIGGGALLVGPPARLPFFPAVYNEDWLFLLSLLQDGRSARSTLGWGGIVHQDEYDGFSALRARSEELGDMLGEGLLSLVHEGRNPLVDHPEHGFWRDVIAARRRMIRGLVRDLRRSDDLDPVDREHALVALEASLTVHRQVEARAGFWTDQFVRYVPAWISDLEMWHARLARSAFGDTSDLLPPLATLVVGADAATAFGLAAGPSPLVRPVNGRAVGTLAGSTGGPLTGLVIERLRPGSWEMLRALRLEALERDPDGLLGSRSDERSRPEQFWRAECGAGRWFGAILHGEPVAVALLREYREQWPSLNLESMWVTPDLRGQGVARAMVQYVETQVRAVGQPALGLWVSEGNHAARRLYESAGYAPTGRRAPAPDGRAEVELARAL